MNEEWKKRISRCCRPSLGISGRRGIKLMSKSPQKRRILYCCCVRVVFWSSGPASTDICGLAKRSNVCSASSNRKNREIKCRHLYVGATDDSSCWHQIADIHPWISHRCWMLTDEELHISGYAVIYKPNSTSMSTKDPYITYWLELLYIISIRSSNQTL